nr:unnamed protein product [Callosobruchus analis]
MQSCVCLPAKKRRRSLCKGRYILSGNW